MTDTAYRTVWLVTLQEAPDVSCWTYSFPSDRTSQDFILLSLALGLNVRSAGRIMMTFPSQEIAEEYLRKLVQLEVGIITDIWYRRFTETDFRIHGDDLFRVYGIKLP